MRLFRVLLLTLLLCVGLSAASAQTTAAPVSEDTTNLATLERQLTYEAGLNAKLQQLITMQEKESDAKLTDLELRFREAFLAVIGQDNTNFFELTYACNQIAQLHTECSGGNFPFYLTRKRMEMAVQRYAYIRQTVELLNQHRESFSASDCARLDKAMELSGKLESAYKQMLNGLNSEQERFSRVSHYIGLLDRYANGTVVEKYALLTSDSAQLEVRDLLNGTKPQNQQEEARVGEVKQEQDEVADALKNENSDLVKAYAMNVDLNDLKLEDEIKVEGRLAARIITELCDPANPFRKLSYNYPYWSLWAYVPKSFTNSYLKSSDPAFAAALGHALLWLLGFALLSGVLSLVLGRLMLRRHHSLSSARVHAFSFAFAVLMTSLMLWGYRLFAVTDGYLAKNLGFLANFLVLAAILFGSLCIRLRSKYVASGTKLFVPFFVLNLLMVAYCIMRCPTFLVRMTSPVVFAICGLWMAYGLLRRMAKIRITARVIAVLSILLMGAGVVFCFEGYYYLMILVELSWFVLVTNILLLSTIGKIGKFISRRISTSPACGRYRHYIAVWLSMLIAQMVQPLIFLGLLWYGLRWPAQGFNLGQFFNSWMGTPYHFSGTIRTVSGDNIILIISVGIALNCLLHIIGQTLKIVQGNSSESGRSVTWLTLGSMLAWGSFVIFALNRLDADYNSILVVMGGMSVGVGLGLKDNIDNLIGGISLMLGRLRPGDVVECDGVRGNVVNIGYRTTSLETLDGSVIVFQNSQLFAQNFRNLTRNHQYERCIVSIGVTYGTDVDRARRLILQALRGIPGLTRQHPSSVLLDNFGDSSVNLSIVVWVPVSAKLTTLSRVREAVYRTFNANGIEIPFPQQDLYIKPLPGAEVPPELKP